MACASSENDAHVGNRYGQQPAKLIRRRAQRSRMSGKQRPAVREAPAPDRCHGTGTVTGTHPGRTPQDGGRGSRGPTQGRHQARSPPLTMHLTLAAMQYAADPVGQRPEAEADFRQALEVDSRQAVATNPGHLAQTNIWPGDETHLRQAVATPDVYGGADVALRASLRTPVG